MEPPGEPPDRDSSHSNQSLTNYSGKVSLGDHSITEKLSRPMAFDKVCLFVNNIVFMVLWKLFGEIDGAISY